jgi:hypothetical protein
VVFEDSAALTGIVIATVGVAQAVRQGLVE